MRALVATAQPRLNAAATAAAPTLALDQVAPLPARLPAGMVDDAFIVDLRARVNDTGKEHLLTSALVTRAWETAHREKAAATYWNAAMHRALVATAQPRLTAAATAAAPTLALDHVVPLPTRLPAGMVDDAFIVDLRARVNDTGKEHLLTSALVTRAWGTVPGRDRVMREMLPTSAGAMAAKNAALTKELKVSSAAEIARRKVIIEEQGRDQAACLAKLTDAYEAVKSRIADLDFPVLGTDKEEAAHCFEEVTRVFTEAAGMATSPPWRQVAEGAQGAQNEVSVSRYIMGRRTRDSSQTPNPKSKYLNPQYPKL